MVDSAERIPMGRRRKRITGEERRHQILQRARHLFQAQGVRGTSMREIANAAGINEGLIYRYFPSKEALFFEAIIEPLHDAIGDVAVRADTIAYRPDLETIHAFVNQTAKQLLELVVEILPSFGLVVFGDRATAQRFYADSLRPTLDTMERVFNQNLPRWPHRDVKAAFGMRAILGICLMMAIDAQLSGIPIDFEVAAEQIADLAMHGLLAEDLGRPVASTDDLTKAPSRSS